ncbi:MAG: Glycerol-3-phosphate transporter ATP-binding protein [Rhizobacter sp.]|nr:Glycerol-3-phosphate transporter ATP-binding protein [Rhizobacter sp.]
MASVTLDHLDKHYGAVHAVQDVNLQIEDGEFFGLLGPSGSGKTSVLRILAGLEQPTGGRLLFDGKPVHDLTPQARNVAMVFEQNALYPHMTARQNVSYPLKIRGTPKPQMQAQVDEVAALLNIAHLLDRRASQMSGGQQQRVAIARALVRRPNLLCLDEPIAHLDTLLRARLRGELKRLQRSLGTTSVLVTHDPIEAMTMTDRLAVMREGVLQQVGTPSEIHDQPVNAFVAQFFGLHSMNLLRIEELTGTDALQGRLSGAPVSLPKELRLSAGSTRTVLVGARPNEVEVLKMGDGAVGNGRLEVAGSVYISEQIGDAQLITVQIGDTTLQSLAPGIRSFGIDEPVRVSIGERGLYVFDAETQRTLRHGRPQPNTRSLESTVMAA